MSEIVFSSDTAHNSRSFFMVGRSNTEIACLPRATNPTSLSSMEPFYVGDESLVTRLSLIIGFPALEGKTAHHDHIYV